MSYDASGILRVEMLSDKKGHPMPPWKQLESLMISKVSYLGWKIQDKWRIPVEYHCEMSPKSVFFNVVVQPLL